MALPPILPITTETYNDIWSKIDSNFLKSVESIEIPLVGVDANKIKLKLFDGTYLTGPVIPFPVTGANNGLSFLSGIVKLGGALLTGTAIDTATFNFLIQSGTTAQRLRISNTFAELAGALELRIAPPSIDAATASVGDFLKLVDDSTGECDYGVITASDLVSLSIVGDNIRLTFKGGTFLETAGLPARSYAENHIAASAATVIAVAGTYVKAAGTTTLDDASSDFTQPVNNRLLYGGTTTKKFLLNISLSFQTTAANQTLAARIYKNGIAETTSTMTTRAETSGQPTAISINQFIELATNDYIEIWVANLSNANNVTVINSSLSLLQL